MGCKRSQTDSFQKELWHHKQTFKTKFKKKTKLEAESLDFLCKVELGKC